MRDGKPRRSKGSMLRGGNRRHQQATTSGEADAPGDQEYDRCRLGDDYVQQPCAEAPYPKDRDREDGRFLPSRRSE